MLDHPIEVPGVLEILQEAQDKISTMVGRPFKLYALEDSPEAPQATILTKRDRIIRQAILDVCGLESWKEVEVKSRKRERVIARQLYCYFAKKHLKGLTLKAIGENVGKRDHTTAIHGIQTINDLLDTQESDVVWKVIQISNKIKAKIYEAEAHS